MPATCGSTAQLRKLRQKCEGQKARKQVSLKMRARKKPIKARTCTESQTMDQEAEAGETTPKASQKGPKSCGKGKAKHQAGSAAAQAVPSRGLQDATQTVTPPVAEPCSGGLDDSVHQKAAYNDAVQQEMSAEPASASAILSMHPQQHDRHLSESEDEAAAASAQPQHSTPFDGSAATGNASTAAASGGQEIATISAQQALPVPPASNIPPQQAADASAAAPPGQPVQEQPNPRREALRMMVNAGVRKEEGALALAAVPENLENAEEWAMAAIEWLTVQMELRGEISDMDRAMQVSLEEAEQQKQQQRAPLDMPEQELLAHFKGSVLIPKLKESAYGETILHSPLKSPVVALLELEQKACRWYSTAGTKAFFLRLGEQCKQEAAMLADHSSEGASCKRQKLSSEESEHHSTDAAEARAPTALCAFLDSKAQEVQAGLYQMPSTSGEVPAIFMAVDGTPEENEVTAGEQATEELVLDGDTIVLD